MKPHKHAELIKAWADGAEIQERYAKGKHPDDFDWVDFDGDWSFAHSNEYDFRIKPEPKPDVVKYMYQPSGAKGYEWYEVNEESFEMVTHPKETIKLLRDGETGELKSAEVLK
jgi:hypothetical protein